ITNELHSTGTNAEPRAGERKTWSPGRHMQNAFWSLQMVLQWSRSGIKFGELESLYAPDIFSIADLEINIYCREECGDAFL
ncbi:hypothetical protein SK128_002546, partial [Halocaridina rubra]